MESGRHRDRVRQAQGDRDKRDMQHQRDMKTEPLRETQRGKARKIPIPTETKDTETKK